MPSLVMTILGEDRPGLVQSLASLVSANGGNWLDSRMAHLAGHFAGILHLEVPSDKVDLLLRALEEMDERGLRVIVQTDESGANESVFWPMQLEVVGNDRSGIVHEVTRLLAHHGVNVEDFRTEVVSAPMSGGRFFRVDAQLRLPPDLTREQLQRHLEEISQDLMVDLSLKKRTD